VGTGRYKGAGWLLGGLLAACAIDPPPTVTLPAPPDQPTSDEPAESTPATHPPRNTSDAGVDAGMVSIPQETLSGCLDGATKPCGPDSVAGMCKPGTRVCHDGIWGECDGAVLPAERDCSSPLDNDCDGLPDNTVDDYCRCVPGMDPEPCDAHPGFDGNGPCHAGTRTCVLSADRQTSDWSQCSGAVGPVPEDSCVQKSDDSNCNGRPNDNCPCIEGEQADCGPTGHAVGICKLGKQTCVNGKYGDCVGATYPQPRDCTSPLDNDCDGKADNATLDSACTCLVNSTQPCEAHGALDGLGICHAGSQTCQPSTDKKTSKFGTCTGSVGPKARDCTSPLDNDCNGALDNIIDTVCTCVIGTSVSCGAHPGDGKGICHAGLAVCGPGPSGNSSSVLGACTGSVGPLAADSCTVPGDDSNCDGVANGGCECVVSTSCPSPAAARCSAGKCVACTTSADCTHIAGLGVCSAGSCVECTAASAAACLVGEVCDALTSTCVAEPPPPPVTPAAPETPEP
jgi:hypothetical protein